MRTGMFTRRLSTVALVASSVVELVGVSGANAAGLRVAYHGHVQVVESAMNATGGVADSVSAFPRDFSASWSNQTLAQQLNLGDNAHVLSTSCVSSSFCVAGGTYTNGSGAQAFVSIYDGSSWTDQPVGAALNVGGLAQVNSVSCVSTTFCVAGGQYTDASGGYQAFVSRFNGSSWSDLEVAATLNLGSSAQVTSLSCVSSTFCVAGGQYTDASGGYQAFVSRFNGSSWSDLEVAATLNLGHGAATNAVSCVSPTFCVAGGEYSDASGGYQAFVSRFNGSSWSDLEIGAALNGGGLAQVNSLSCVSSTFCVAGGQYTDASGMSQAFVSVYDGSTWSDLEIGATLNAGNDARVHAVSCVASTFCVAGGQYTDASGMSQAFVSVYDGSTWADQTLASALNLGGAAQTNTVSCVSSSYCVAGGDYTDATGIRALVSVYDGSTWADQTLASALNLGGDAAVHSVICVPSGFCVAGGTYTDAANHAQAFVSTYDNVLQPVAPVAPTFVSAASFVTVVSKHRSQTITVTWTSVVGATSYQCQLLYGHSMPASAPVSTTSTSCRFSGRRLGIRYAIAITAVNATGPSATAIRFVAPPIFTLTCTHGRQRLRRTGTNPRCPAGWATR